ncbi:hypothetical protein U9M73_20475 [Paenibacillus phoenicis]|uniref:Transposase IS111A/IS1328/IS1533 N-terminal domain-containing protein n=1 Tax=Paenibacillus phoenicis TaxID=554117 RepID=A0ABU5PQR9_9BACL|nr:hypothetical protein [Paenibacillus phoenicis]MEA3572306.1 hypothetical protein [Paenibacillus phoenicis]
MRPVIGLDVSKGTSVLQAFTDRNKPYGNSITVETIRETAGSSHSKAWIQTKAEKIQEKIQALPSLSKSSKAQQTALLSMVEMV